MTLVLLVVVVGATPKSAEIDPKAVAALERMSAAVRQLLVLSVKAQLETDEVLAGGQKVTRTSAIALTVHRPNRLHAEIVSERTHRQLFYDGQAFTIFSPRAGCYASASAPGTIADLVTLAAERYAIELPLADLFPWEQLAAGEVRAAIDLGPAWVEGVECEHYAFRQAGLDWQVWIEKAEHALPRKLQVTSTSDEARPDRRVTYRWALGLVGDERQFTFTPPKDARKIGLTERARLAAEAP